MTDWEEKIRERAYAIWLDQGSIDGRDQENWLEAEKEIAKEEAAARSEVAKGPVIPDMAAAPPIPESETEPYEGSPM